MGIAAQEHAPRVAALLADPEWRVRAAAPEALKAMGALKEYVPKIADLLDDKPVRLAAVEVLGSMGPAAKAYAPKIATLLEDFPTEDSHILPETLTAMGPLDITGIPYILSPIYDTKSRAGELRFLAHFLGGGEQDVESFIRWLGRPDQYPLSVSRDDGIKTLEVFAKAWEPSSSLPTLRADLEQQIARVANQVTWQVSDLPLLRRHTANLEATRSTHAASMRNVVASLESWLWIHEHVYIIIAVAAYIALFLVWLAFLWLRPLWLYRINEALKPYTDFALPALAGEHENPPSIRVPSGVLSL